MNTIARLLILIFLQLIADNGIECVKGNKVYPGARYIAIVVSYVLQIIGLTVLVSLTK